MAKPRTRPNQGQKLEIKVIPPQYLDLPLAEITRLLGNGPLLWPGGVGRSRGVKFVPYDIKKKRGRKPKHPPAAAGQPAPGRPRKSSS